MRLRYCQTVEFSIFVSSLVVQARLFELGSAHATLRAEASAADKRAKQAESEANAFQMQLSERDEQLAQRAKELEQARARISELENEASDQAEKLMRSARDREAELATGFGSFPSFCWLFSQISCQKSATCARR